MRETDYIDPADIHAISIAGLGEPDTDAGASNGYLICTGSAREYQAILSNWQVKPHLKHASLEGKSHDLTYFQSKTKYSAFEFGFRATDEQGADFFGDAEISTTEVTAYADTTTTTMELADPGLADTPVWINSECILLGSHTGGGTYTGCTRGYYSSRQEPHRTGANVYDYIHEWAGRIVRLYTLTYDGGPTADSGGSPTDAFTLTQRWWGKIHSGPEQDKGTLTLDTWGLFGGEDPIPLAREDRTISDHGQLTLKRADLGRSIIDAGSTTYETSIYKPSSILPYDQVCAVVEGEVVQLRGTDGDYTISDGPLFGRDFRDIQSDTRNGIITVDSPEDIYEVMAFDADFENVLTTEGPGLFPWRSSRINSAYGTDFEDFFDRHPLTYYAILNLSTRTKDTNPAVFDILQRDWSTNNRPFYVDNITDRIKALIRATPEYQMNHFVLGWGNSSVDLRRKSREWFLRPWGFDEAPTKNGEVDLVQATTVDADTYDAALSNKIAPVQSDTLNQDSGRSSVIRGAKLTVGGLPMEGETPRSAHVVDADNDANRAAYLRMGTDIEFDFSTVKPERLEWVKSIVVDKVAVQSLKIPTVQFELEDWQPNGLDYGIGKAAHLEDIDIEPAWLWDRDGERVSDFSDDVQWTGVFTGQHWLPQRMAYAMTLYLIGRNVGRWRAPTGIIRDWRTSGGSHILTLQGNAAADSAYGLSATDVSYFTPGDDVAIWRPDGTYWSGNPATPLEVDSVDTGAQEITLSNTYWSDPPRFGRVELAGLDSDSSGAGYENQGLNGRFTNVVRAYMFLADTSDTLGDADLEGDQYAA